MPKPPDRQQVKFASQVIKINDFYKKRTGRDLILIGTEGLCDGICYSLRNAINQGQKGNFFNLYNLICDCNPEAFAEALCDKPNFTNKVCKFLSEIVILQWRQRDAFNSANTKGMISYFAKDPVNSLPYNPSNNNERVGGKISYKKIQNYKKFDDLLPILYDQNNQTDILQDGQQIIISIEPQIRLRWGHSILIYKEEGKYRLFDPNDGVEREFSDAVSATKYIVEQYNKLYCSTLVDSFFNTFPSLAEKKITQEIGSQLISPFEKFKIMSTHSTRLFNFIVDNFNKDLNEAVIKDSNTKNDEEIITNFKFDLHVSKFTNN